MVAATIQILSTVLVVLGVFLVLPVGWAFVAAGAIGLVAGVVMEVVTSGDRDPIQK